LGEPQYLIERGCGFTSTDHLRHVEKAPFIGIDFDESISESQQTSVLPDGQVITIGNERFRLGCPEFLSKPFLIGLEAVGILVTPRQFDHEVRRSDLYSNIVLLVLFCLVTITFEGITERMTKEIVTPAPRTILVSNSFSIFVRISD